MSDKHGREYVCISQIFWESPSWTAIKFDPERAFLDLALSASSKDYVKVTKSVKVPIKRGQSWTSITSLTSRWGWSRNTVKAHLKKWKQEGRIRIAPVGSNAARGILITIIGYDDIFVDGGLTLDYDDGIEVVEIDELFEEPEDHKVDRKAPSLTPNNTNNQKKPKNLNEENNSSSESGGGTPPSTPSGTDIDAKTEDCLWPLICVYNDYVFDVDRHVLTTKVLKNHPELLIDIAGKPDGYHKKVKEILERIKENGETIHSFISLVKKAQNELGLDAHHEWMEEQLRIEREASQLEADEAETEDSGTDAGNESSSPSRSGKMRFSWEREAEAAKDDEDLEALIDSF